MTEVKDFFEVFEDITRFEKIMVSISKYNRSRGGGILWIIFYWFLYIFSFYAVTSLINFDIYSLSKSIGFLMFIITGFLLFLIIGCFLIYGVSHQISIMRRWYKQLFIDYKSLIEHNASYLGLTIAEKDSKRYLGIENQDLKTLLTSLQEFEARYFPKKNG